MKRIHHDAPAAREIQLGSRAALRLASYPAIAVAACVLLVMPRPRTMLHAGSGIETLDITGTVRDFRSSDAGFAPPASTSWSHVAGNVDLALDANHRPVFNGGGFAVGTQWRNGAGEPIAPHLYKASASNIIKVASAPTITSTAVVVDTWSSNMGAYGGTNVGSAPTWQTGSSMPAVSAPSPLPAKITDILYDGSGTSSLGVNRYCTTFTLSNYRVLNITADMYIYATDSFKIQNFAELNLLNGASLTIYVGKDFLIENNVKVNTNTWSPSRLTIVNLGTTTMVMKNSGQLCGTIISPNGPLLIQNSNQFYGSFTGKSVQLDNTAGFHVDVPNSVNACGVEFADSAGAESGGSDGAIPSASDFAEWFADVLPRNLFTASSITLEKNASGVYEYQNDAFFPIDGMLFGNEGRAHNYYFTYTFTVEFVHRACEGRFFEFEGSDDAWMFVDGQLALDLGGIRAGVSQYVEFDRLDLVDGEIYRLHFFYAQRNPTAASFGIRTNLDLIRPNSPLAINSGND